MKANLHLHSRFSDGTDWPAAVARRAAGAGLGLVALTDHDCLSGGAAFHAAAAARGLRAVTACELDVGAKEIDYRSELLAYFPGLPPVATALHVERQLQRRRDRIGGFIDSCRRLFSRPDLSLDELLALKMASGWAEGGTLAADPGEAPSPAAISLNKVDLFRYLLHRGLLAPGTAYPAFRKEWFSSGRIPDEGFRRATAEEAIAAVRSDSGLVVLPHPGHEFGDAFARMEAELPRLRRLLDWCVEAGLAGVELYWYGSRETEAINALVRREAAARGLFPTWGSDCHGPGSGKETMAAFSGDFGGFPGHPLA